MVKDKHFKNPVYLRNNYSDKAIFYQVFYEGQYQLDALPKIHPHYIVDAGANVGLAALYFSNHFPDAKILALEPEPENFSLLRKNTDQYSNITPLEKAIWYKDGSVSIINPDAQAASFSVAEGQRDCIPAISIPTLLEEFNWPGIDILKIDIEGAEREVFSSDTEWLQKVKLIIIELHDGIKPGTTKTFFNALAPYDYQAYFHHENIFIYLK